MPMTGVAEGPGPHVPVMLAEVLEAVDPKPGKTIVDATFGAGGYSRAFLEAGAQVVAIDRDPDAIRDGTMLAAKHDGLVLLEGRFGEIESLIRNCDIEAVDAIVADIGVSSMQIDQAERGFSFQKDGPLDMRMSQDGESAADVVNTYERPDLTRIIGILGDERQASRISAEIVEWRANEPFATTLQLARCVEKVVGRKPGDRIHPATRTFQALRIHVNGELEELADLCLAAERLLPEGGRFVVVTFHSLEDRLLKKFLQDRSTQASGSRHLPSTVMQDTTFELVTRNPVQASAEEAERNPRARSAKLRAATRTATPARPDDRQVFGLPRLAESAGSINRTNRRRNRK